jgi:hypothetical protein
MRSPFLLPLRGLARRLALVALVAAAAAALAPSLAAQAAASASPPPPLTAAERRAAVDSVAAMVARYYVSPDTGAMIARHLRARLAGGAFDAAAAGPALADALSREMRAVNGDGHLYATFRPAPGSVAASALEQSRRGGPGPRVVAGPGGAPAAGGGAAMVVASGGGGPVRRGPSFSEATLAEMRRRNFSLPRAERLDGNVGYLEITAFEGSEEARDAAAAALAFLGRTDALILDVRRAPGGSGEMTEFLASWFLPDSTLLMQFYDRLADASTESYTTSVPGPKRLDVPLYVLTSGASASAAEALPFMLQARGRATVVGERTAGAGFRNWFFPAPAELAVSISIGRPSAPGTNRGWERVGVQPDVAVPAAQARAVAHAHALRALEGAATEPRRRRELAWAREVAERETSPTAVAPALLATYAGAYGDRRIDVEGGTLTYRRRPDRPAEALVAIDDTTFALGSTARLRFARGDGGAWELRVESADGQVAAYARTP